MARAGKPKHETDRTRESQESDKSPISDSADQANPADEIEALEAGGRDRSWHWHGTRQAADFEGVTKGGAGNKVAAVAQPFGETRRPRRRTRPAPRPASPRGRTR